MSYRGSFTKCVDAMGKLFSQARFELLHIVECEAGKYYVLCTSEELEQRIIKYSNKPERICVSLTRKELRLLYDIQQKDLFSE